MKILMKPIKVYALWDDKGKIEPLAICFEENGEKIKFSVKLESREEQRIAGHMMIHFFCHCQVGGSIRSIVLRYDIRACRWYLYKG